MPNSGLAQRVIMSDGDTPPDDLGSLLTSNWDDSLAEPYDAVITNGMVRANFIADVPSYITWMFRRSAISLMKINVAGTFRGMWIKLAGLESVFNNSPNGWLTMNSLYTGYGVPGSNGISNGCALGTHAMNHKGQTYIATFGTQNSSNAKNNIILIRFRLERYDTISSLSITGMD